MATYSLAISCQWRSYAMYNLHLCFCPEVTQKYNIEQSHFFPMPSCLGHHPQNGFNYFQVSYRISQTLTTVEEVLLFFLIFKSSFIITEVVMGRGGAGGGKSKADMSSWVEDFFFRNCFYSFGSRDRGPGNDLSLDECVLAQNVLWIKGDFNMYSVNTT